MEAKVQLYLARCIIDDGNQTSSYNLSHRLKQEPVYF